MHEYDYDQYLEEHEFMVMAAEPMEGYYFANFRFGHSHSILDTVSLWAFNEWMSFYPEYYPLDPAFPVFISIDWEGRLPYPQGENYLGQYDPADCTVYLPQDLNRDCCVNFKDFAIFADAWLQCTYLGTSE